MGKVRFKDETGKSTEKSVEDPWIILVADDEGDVHLVTEMVLKDFRFSGKPLKLIPAKSGKETIDLLSRNPNVAVMLLDVVMESFTSGLDVVTAVRNDIGNQEVRIILRSGQAGYANVSKILRQYDVNDYKRKEELTENALKDTVLLALRAYRDIQRAKGHSA